MLSVESSMARGPVHGHDLVRVDEGRLGAVVGPCLHQLAAPREQIGALIGALHSAGDRMCQRLLAHLPRKVGALRAPCAERGTEAVQAHTGTKALQEAQHRLAVEVEDTAVARPEAAKSATA